MTIFCPTCEKSHRDPEGLDKCKLRAEKRAEREAAKQAEVERRLENRKALPEQAFILKKAWEGLIYDRIVSGLNKDYPVQEQGKWTLWDVADVIAGQVKWPGFSQEQITTLLLEKHALSAYVTAHPLQFVRWPDGVESVDHLMARVRAQEERERGIEEVA